MTSGMKGRYNGPSNCKQRRNENADHDAGADGVPVITDLI